MLHYLAQVTSINVLVPVGITGKAGTRFQPVKRKYCDILKVNRIYSIEICSVAFALISYPVDIGICLAGISRIGAIVTHVPYIVDVGIVLVGISNRRAIIYLVRNLVIVNVSNFLCDFDIVNLYRTCPAS